MTRPQPSGGFEWVQAPAGPALVCRPLERVATHLFTTRPWPLGSPQPPGAEAWDAVAAAVGLGGEALVRARQVHGVAALVRRRDAATPLALAGLPSADLLLTDDPAAAVAVQTADCVPLLLADGRRGAVAAVHAGWRGLAEGAPAIAAVRLAGEFGSRPEDLLAAIGPTIGACCYEVGEDVVARFRDRSFAAADLARWFAAGPPPGHPVRRSGQTPGPRWRFDPAAAARDQLIALGYEADLDWS